MTPAMQVVVAAGVSVIASAIMLSPFMNLAHLATAVHTGDGREQAWMLAWVAHALTSSASLFDANMFFPEAGALAHEDHLFALTAFATPLWLATGNAILTFNVLMVLGPAVSALGGFLLARAWTGDWAAAIVGGLAFGLSFFTMLHNAHLNLTWAAGLPLSMLLLDRWWRAPTWTNLAWLWLVVLFTALTSGYLMVLLATILVIHVVVLALLLGRLEPATRVPQLGVALVLGTAALLPLVVPYLKYANEAGETAVYAANVRSYLVPPENTLVGRWLVGRGLVSRESIWGEQTLFVGGTVLVLAGVGLLDLARSGMRERRGYLWPLLAVLVVPLALSFGSSESGLAPFDLVARLPGFSGFRATARFALIVSLAMAMLAAFGLARLRRAAPRAATALTVVVAIVMLGEWFVVDFPAGHPPPEPVPMVYRLARADGARAAVALPMYAQQPEYYKEGDYLLYTTTAEFLPLVNGIGRWAPPLYVSLSELMRAFPSPATAAALRQHGVTHVILHSARYGNDAARLRQEVRHAPDFVVVADLGDDILLRVNSQRPTSSQ